MDISPVMIRYVLLETLLVVEVVVLFLSWPPILNSIIRFSFGPAELDIEDERAVWVTNAV
jgi:hypothetical protein